MQCGKPIRNQKRRHIFESRGNQLRKDLRDEHNGDICSEEIGWVFSSGKRDGRTHDLDRKPPLTLYIKMDNSTPDQTGKSKPNIHKIHMYPQHQAMRK
jgi:hypothetical protein